MTRKPPAKALTQLDVRIEVLREQTDKSTWTYTLREGAWTTREEADTWWEAYRADPGAALPNTSVRRTAPLATAHSVPAPPASRSSATRVK